MKGAAASILLLVLSTAGCYDGPAMSETRTYEASKKIHVSGEIRWHGDLGVEELRVSASPPPMRIPQAGPTLSSWDLEMDKASAGKLTYELAPLPVQGRVKIVRTEEAWWGGPKQTLGYESKITAYWMVQVEPPPGWRAEPDEIRVTESTKEADFVLVRESRLTKQESEGEVSSP